MKPLVVGSTALKVWLPESNITPKDIDVISDEPIAGTEWHNPELLNNELMSNIYRSNKIIIHNGIEMQVMNLKGLAIMKRSHLHRDLSFNKHIAMYHKHLAHIQLDEIDREVLQERVALTHKQYPVKHPKLNVTKDQFFNDAVTTRTFDHDFLHEQVAFYSTPLYIKLQNESDEIWCHKSKWDKLSHKNKILCTVEEIEVTALERFLIPNIISNTRIAYVKSLNKVCTTMCSGWFRDFAIDNYPELINMFNKHKLQTIKEQLCQTKQD